MFMFNRILMELYDDYEQNNNISLVEFGNKTFSDESDENVRNLFVGSVLILFSMAVGFKPRYSCTRENLLAIVKSGKVKVNDTNLLLFYIDYMNQTKGISKYLNKILNDEAVDKYLDILIDYLEQFKPRFIEDAQEAYNKKNKNKPFNL